MEPFGLLDLDRCRQRGDHMLLAHEASSNPKPDTNLDGAGDQHDWGLRFIDALILCGVLVLLFAA